ncbi:MATE family efflux transporter [Haloimpatiens lingqiaonensis]|uniref:MATE family efflux transporter n=1 Tax=Haloimpatiens lingqiaonensis TaxID=1380675 RepID=UPI0010FDEB9E|nr:MATE family efflux transporter [Haloimpatiens lingqiaonensis]
MRQKNDFTKGSVPKRILSLALPMTLAQLINILYNIVDRMYIGRIPGASTLALTGIGITLPIITIIMAFANLFGMGGAPLCSIARGRGDIEEAEKIMGNSFSLLIIFGAALTILGLIFKKPLLFLFGSSSSTFSYANDYITIYLIGSIFVMISLGMNSFINCQGFGRIGMMTILLGAITNIILDPIFIFLLHMGVKGAALATVISQFLSCYWVLKFLTGRDAILRLKYKNFKINLSILKRIVFLGLSSFIMALTNSVVQVVCNITLQIYGGDLYIGIMTIINSVREIIMMPVRGITNGSQPVLGFNYGAKEYGRVRSGIKFMSVVCIIYTFALWLILRTFPEFFIRIFNNNPELIKNGVPAMNIYFFGFFMMSLQFSGQSTYVALGKSKQAIFFSLLRKIIIVVPLTLMLPKMFNLGTNGVFLAEPISNFLGGLACYITMLLTVWPRLKEKKECLNESNIS